MLAVHEKPDAKHLCIVLGKTTLIAGHVNLDRAGLVWLVPVD